MARGTTGQTEWFSFGHEVTANADGSQVSAVRPYSFEGDPVATRTAAGVDYLVSGPGGSVESAVPSGGTAPTGRRSYAPYGKVRSVSGDLATDRGFLGQVEDASTGLSYLNARYYDTRIGLFISTDPIYNTDRIQTLNPYSYSVNNPTTYSDPGGLYSGYTFGLEVENAKLRASWSPMPGRWRQRSAARPPSSSGCRNGSRTWNGSWSPSSGRSAGCGR